MTVPGLAIGYRAFRLPRQGYRLEECQDASAGDAERGRFALADGAAESPYSALWAHLLVETWRAVVTDAGFEEIEHYYRPAGKPREQQPWLATVFRRRT